ncbi:MAG TPA: GntR family transcriptional regulator, partial [Bradyrhizobium sp.]
MSKKSTRVDLACQALRQAIIEQALPPGTKLPEDELGLRFGMSRTLVR